MSSKYEESEAFLTAISAKLPLVYKDDLSVLADIMQNLELLSGDAVLPVAFKKQAKRTAQLSEKIIINETPFDSGMKKLSQSIGKMAKGLTEFINNAHDAEVAAEDKENEDVQRDVSEAEALCNAISAKLPLVDSDDLSTLADIMQNLEMLAADPALPPSFQGQAKEAVQLSEKIIMNETPFDSGMEELSQGIDKMVKGITGFNNDTPDSDAEVAAEDKENKDVQEGDLPDDLKELVIKFASQQQQVLEDFEGLCLDFEQNKPEARGGIKRILHTWKGEFGVLDQQNYSKLVHGFEEKFESDDFAAESLFRLKDFLTEKLNRFAAGEVPEITEGEEKYLFQTQEKSSKPGSGKKKKETKPQKKSSPKEEKKDTPVEIQEETTEPQVVQTFTGDPSLLADFISESREHLDNAEPLLLELEEDPTDSDNLNTIFRACHTIKGVAGFLGFSDISHLSHSMENLMDLGRKGEVILTAEHIDVLLQGMDCLRGLTDAVEKMLSDEPYTVPEQFADICEKLSSPNTICGVPEASNKKMGEILVERGQAEPKDIEEAVLKQNEGDSRKVGEILIQEKEVPPRAVANALASQNAAKQHKTAVEETIRVPVERLDQLIDSIGEAVIAQSMVYADQSITSIRNRGLEKNISQASLIMRQIQELSMSLRMVSVKSTFQKMARLVRDLSKKTGKQVEMIMEGEDTELDKSVVENIGDPLIHMIRNSMDHGIESKEERRKSGKPERARVTLRAYHRAGSVVIEIEDDGKGLDKEVILKKAIEKGLAKEEQNYSDQEIFQFIFKPGFSTAKVVTDVSGRGVGMDVVRRNIEALRGSTEITSEPGKGTCFAIKLPLTLAIIDGMVIQAKNDTYIIPTLSIIESIKPRENQIETVLEKGETIKVRGNLHPLVRLSNMFNGSSERTDLTEGIVMIVEDMLGRKIGLFIDDIVGQQQVVIKSLGTSMRNIPGVSGGAIMSDGTVSLILDVGGIVRMATG